VTGVVEREAPEAPGVPVIRETGRVERPGGAGAVAAMAAALGAQVSLAGFPTALRERFWVGGAMVGRRDVDARPVCVAARAAALAARVGAVLVADHGLGTCSAELLRGVFAAAAGAGVPVLVDPARGRDWSAYRGASLVKCNRAEWEAASRGRPPYWWRAHAVELVVTDGARGLTHHGAGGEAVTVPAAPAEAADPTGCGDMVLACLGACAAAGVPRPAALRFAAAMAAREATVRGAVGVDPAGV
jgi:D-beta-D-heptose 7-phosphate kinase/D-beta-D-heptose 1-phosphate adenosyltransferase